MERSGTRPKLGPEFRPEFGPKFRPEFQPELSPALSPLDPFECRCGAVSGRCSVPKAGAAVGNSPEGAGECWAESAADRRLSSSLGPCRRTDSNRCGCTRAVPAERPR